VIGERTIEVPDEVKGSSYLGRGCVLPSKVFCRVLKTRLPDSGKDEIKTCSKGPPREAWDRGREDHISSLKYLVVKSCGFKPDQS